MNERTKKMNKKNDDGNDLKSVLNDFKINGNYEEKEFNDFMLWIDGFLENKKENKNNYCLNAQKEVLI